MEGSLGGFLLCDPSGGCLMLSLSFSCRPLKIQGMVIGRLNAILNLRWFEWWLNSSDGSVRSWERRLIE
ncbi:hypothetical protein MKHDV_01941 [Halodesulfovibrio sp. MK-HDV]|nr:hypothetical protein MKHDV_01941 [Halodesulfovibrio sp. MK-HDV]